jgi:hypothetical protein
MPNLILLDLVVSQVQGSIDLARMPDPRPLNLVISQIQNSYLPPLGLT